LVIELVDGPTLAERIEERGRAQSRENHPSLWNADAAYQ